MRIIGPVLVVVLVARAVEAQSERPTFPLQFVDLAPADLSGLHTADVDADGDLDILAASSGHLEVRLGDGHGYFAEERQSTVAASTFGLVVGDIDADGLPDAALSSGSDNGVQVLTGAGDGTFALTSLVLVGPDPREPVLGDLDGDGDLDLALVRTTVGRLVVAMGDGAGGFGPISGYATAGALATELTVADVDGDLDLDLVVAFDATSGVQLFRNGGTGVFAADGLLVAPSPASDVLVTDLTGDGLVDLVSSHATAVSVFAGQAAGGFAAAQPWGPPLPSGGIQRCLAASDVDGDADVDLVVGPAKLGEDHTYLLLNQGGAAATFVSMKTGFHQGPVALADVNGDGLIDRLTSPYNGNAGVLVALNGLDPHFEIATEVILPLPFRAIASGDVDGDGAPEVVGVCSALAGVTELVSIDTPSLDVAAQTLINLSGSTPNHLFVGDLDGDGSDDAALHDRSADSVLIVHGQAGGGFGTHVSVPTAVDPTFIAGGDLDVDGDLDLLTLHSLGASLALLWNDGAGGFAAPQVLSLPAQPTEAFVVDLDGDPWPDLAIMHSTGTNLSLLFGAGEGAFEPLVPLGIGSSPDDLVVVDLDGDGETDLAVIDSGGLRLMKGVGGGAFVQAFVLSSGALARLDCGDVDGDGLLDLITDTAGGEGTLVYPGADVFAPKAQFACDDDLARSLLLDVDVDGWLDLVLCPGELQIHWNVSNQRGPLEDVGQALPGSSGTPHWSGLGTLQPLSPLALTLAYAKPGAPLTLVIGAAVLEAPFKGGTMVPFPQLLVSGLFANAAGKLSLSTTWPAGIPSGFLLATQCWIVDAAGPAGLSASNGLVLTAP